MQVAMRPSATIVVGAVLWRLLCKTNAASPWSGRLRQHGTSAERVTRDVSCDLQTDTSREWICKAEERGLAILRGGSADADDDAASKEGTSAEMAEDGGATGDAVDVFSWAQRHGAKIAPGIEIRETAYGGRGLFAARDIPADTELIRIPYTLQLGVRQLAEGDDAEMQSFVRALDPRTIITGELGFVPLSIALAAERRRGSESIFAPWLQSLPEGCINAIRETEGNLELLERWAPEVAGKVRRRRRGLFSLHETLAPPSLSLDELRWAASHVCSRSLLRKRVKELSPEQVRRVGELAASDHSRMLPIIDLVNHGSLDRANVWVGRLSRGSDDDEGGDNYYSTSLVSTRQIVAGEELLFDYGGGADGRRIGNDRLLLDYGFVLPDHQERVSIGADELRAALPYLDGLRVGMNGVPKEDVQRLEALIAALTAQPGDGAPLLFFAGHEPNVRSLAAAIAMTCRDADDVRRVLYSTKQMPLLQPPSNGLLPTEIVQGCTELQREFARYALKLAAGTALAQRPSLTEEGDEGSCGKEHEFARVAKEYCKLCERMLLDVADMSR